MKAMRKSAGSFIPLLARILMNPIFLWSGMFLTHFGAGDLAIDSMGNKNSSENPHKSAQEEL